MIINLQESLMNVENENKILSLQEEGLIFKQKITVCK